MRISMKAARINRNMTQEEFARKVHVTKKTVGAWESGRTFPKVDKIQIICDVLGVKYDDISWTA